MLLQETGVLLTGDGGVVNRRRGVLLTGDEGVVNRRRGCC